MTLKQELPSGSLAILHILGREIPCQFLTFQAFCILEVEEKQSTRFDRSGHQPSLECIVFFFLKKNIFLKLFAHLWLQKLEFLALSFCTFSSRFSFPLVVTRFLGIAYALCTCRQIQGETRNRYGRHSTQWPPALSSTELTIWMFGDELSVYIAGELGSANRACLQFTQHSGKPYHAGLCACASLCVYV